MDETRVRRLEAVAEAARGYRAAMRRYIDAQTELLDSGVPLDAITERNWDRFAETLRAEEGLYDALDALDAAQPGQRARGYARSEDYRVG